MNEEMQSLILKKFKDPLRPKRNPFFCPWATTGLPIYQKAFGVKNLKGIKNE